MSNRRIVFRAMTLAMLGSGLALAQAPPQPPAGPQPMSFFVTSVGVGKGADLGGLAGADAHCQKLAAAVGGGNRTWRAYMSTQGPNAVNARDRIGKGPWFNARGDRVAQDLANLHSSGHGITILTALAENGRIIPGGGFAPNRHDMLTGSQEDGTAYTDAADHTCKNWTSSSDGVAQLGHHDRAAWNSAHPSRGCSQPQLVSSGGDGLFYCFAGQ